LHSFSALYPVYVYTLSIIPLLICDVSHLSFLVAQYWQYKRIEERIVMKNQLVNIYSNTYQPDSELNHKIDSDGLIARFWVHRGINYVKKRYYMKAFLCFETALILDSRSLDIPHHFVHRLIITGRLQEANDIAFTLPLPLKWEIREPWAFT